MYPMIIKRALIAFLTLSTIQVNAQSAYEKLAMQSFMKGDYKIAVAQLEKAQSTSPNNSNILKMLGYAYFQVGDNENSVNTYSTLIGLKPDEFAAYYYRGKARLNIANSPKEALSQMRENFYLAAIKDFTKAIELNKEEESQYYQNRGLAYKDYGIYKSYKAKKNAEKAAVIALFNNSIADFQKILVDQPLRRDIISWSDFVKAQIASLR